MIEYIILLRSLYPGASSYPDTPEILIGLTQGRFGLNGLLRRILELEAYDS